MRQMFFILLLMAIALPSWAASLSVSTCDDVSGLVGTQTCVNVEVECTVPGNCASTAFTLRYPLANFSTSVPQVSLGTDLSTSDFNLTVVVKEPSLDDPDTGLVRVLVAPQFQPLPLPSFLPTITRVARICFTVAEDAAPGCSPLAFVPNTFGYTGTVNDIGDSNGRNIPNIDIVDGGIAVVSPVPTLSVGSGCSDNSVLVGEKVCVPIALSDVGGALVASMGISLEYDATQLSLPLGIRGEDIRPGSALNGHVVQTLVTEGQVDIVITPPDEFSVVTIPNGEVVDVCFTAIGDAPGCFPIEFGFRYGGAELGDIVGKLIPSETADGGITGALVCGYTDFDADGVTSIDDLMAMFNAARSVSSDPMYDINCNGAADMADLSHVLLNTINQQSPPTQGCCPLAPLQP